MEHTNEKVITSMNDIFCFINYKFNPNKETNKDYSSIEDNKFKEHIIILINELYKNLTPSISEKLTEALKNYTLKHNVNPLNSFCVLSIKSSSFRLTDIITFCKLKNETQILKKITHEDAITDFMNDINDYAIYHNFLIFLTKIKESMSQRVSIDNTTKELRDVFIEPIDNIKEYLLKVLVKHSKKELYTTEKNRKTEQFIKNYFKTYIDTTYKLRNLDLDLSIYEDKHKITITEKQKEVIKHILTHKISIIQGSAGTGKSFIMKIVYYLLQKKRERSNAFICISTKAKQVLSNYIFDKPNDNNCMSVSKFLSQDYDFDNVFIDEASMIGNSHLKNILYKTRKRIILVGDKKQILPVLTNGIPFSNLQNHFKYIELTELKRQNDIQTTTILTNYINQEEKTIPTYKGEQKGIFFEYIDNNKDFLEFYLKFNNPMVIKPAKYEELNNVIQTRVQKDNTPYTINNKKFYINDRVVRITNRKTDKNEYSNGSFGTIKSYSNGLFKIHYDTNETEDVNIYMLNNEFQIGYVSSAHRLQGSQYDIVLVYINNCYNLQAEGSKNLLYTSLTRSKQLTIICGSSKAIYDINQSQHFFNPIDDY